MSAPRKTEAELQKLYLTLKGMDNRKTYKVAAYFEPYDKQKQFFTLGSRFPERLLTAGNQQGKTHAGAFEVYVHMTGEYPPWWGGKRFEKPNKGWICGETSVAVRDNQQKKLCGEPGVQSLFGTGMIPKDAFVEPPSLTRGVTNAYDTMQVKHRTGGISIARYKSYEQGREKFQGETLDWAWCDEEPPMDVYMEILARMTATRGITFITFTSLKGNTEVTDRFFKDRPEAMVQMGLRDALHITQDQWPEILDKYRPYERVSRIDGGIMHGQGRVFETEEDVIAEPMIERVPPHWQKIWGIDFGIGHPFAAALLLWDRDNDTFHVHRVIRLKDALSIVHADAIKRIGGNVPVAWPRDGTERDMHSGEPLATMYKKHGLNMLPEHATWPEGGVSTYAGITEMDERFKTGRLRVCQHLHEFFEEYRDYHYDKGKIVKINDDILSAIRTGLMMKRFAKATQLGIAPHRSNLPTMARNVDFDVFDE